MDKRPLDIIEKEMFAPKPAPFESAALPLNEVSELTIPESIAGYRSLNGTYLMTKGEDDIPDFSDSIPAEIPCTVQTALYNAGLIPDPMF